MADSTQLFFSNVVNLNLTFFRGYLYVPSYKYKDVVRALELLGKLVNENIYSFGDCSCPMDEACECMGKSTFNFIGTYKGEPFAIYDWKRDGFIHIGGSGALNLEELIQLITEAIILILKKTD